jgi:tungstate transport system ATP-binding protein
MSVSLKLLDIHKNYHNVRALNSVSLEVKSGKIIVLLGVNGAGKTTIMRIMSGLENPDSGKLFFNNQPIEAKALRKISTLVFQKTAMFSLNVYDNLAYGLRIRGMPEEEIAKKVSEALQSVKLSGFEKRRAKKTSGGEQQRIALARAFLLDSHILLLDEPTANLDPNSATIMERAILSKKSSERIIVLSTHNLSQARRMADKIVNIYNGEIVEIAAPEDFFEKPKSEISQRFIRGELEF